MLRHDRSPSQEATFGSGMPDVYSTLQEFKHRPIKRIVGVIRKWRASGDQPFAHHALQEIQRCSNAYLLNGIRRSPLRRAWQIARGFVIGLRPDRMLE